MNWVGGTWWELQLQPDWEAQDDLECLSIFRSDGGALQLSAAVKTAGEIVISELEDMRARETPNNATQSRFTASQFWGLNASYMEDETLWQKFWLAHGSLMVFATYNGLPSDWDRESADVIAMLESLRIQSTVNVIPS